MFVTAVIKVEVVIKKTAHLLFWVLVFSDNKIIIEWAKILFPGSSVNDLDSVFILVSFISIAIVFLVIAFSQKLMPNQ